MLVGVTEQGSEIDGVVRSGCDADAAGHRDLQLALEPVRQARTDALYEIDRCKLRHIFEENDKLVAAIAEKHVCEIACNVAPVRGAYRVEG